MPKVIKVRKDETATTECPCCGRMLKWVFTTDDGFTGGSRCVAKHCGLKVTPAAYAGIANLQRLGATVTDTATDCGDHFELWTSPKGTPCAISRNGNLVTQGPGAFTSDRWAEIVKYAA